MVRDEAVSGISMGQRVKGKDKESEFPRHPHFTKEKKNSREEVTYSKAQTRSKGGRKLAQISVLLPRTLILLRLTHSFTSMRASSQSYFLTEMLSGHL